LGGKKNSIRTASEEEKNRGEYERLAETAKRGKMPSEENKEGGGDSKKVLIVGGGNSIQRFNV